MLSIQISQKIRGGEKKTKKRKISPPLLMRKKNESFSIDLMLLLTQAQLNHSFIHRKKKWNYFHLHIQNPFKCGDNCLVFVFVAQKMAEFNRLIRQ